MSIINQMLEKYSIESEQDLTGALKEIYQEITLLGLYRGQFFTKAAFYGGTSLRILYGLKRFSDDLDFSLLEKNPSFKLEPYFSFIKNEFEALGVRIQINSKLKTNDFSNIASAFLKNDTSVFELNLSPVFHPFINQKQSEKSIKIKIEVDTNPPLVFQTEHKTLYDPITFNVLSMTLPNLFAGKMHAVLCRKWKTGVKGRDWFDLEWYLKKRVQLNLKHLEIRMIESGDISAETKLTSSLFMQLLLDRVERNDFKKASEEVRPFLNHGQSVNYWSADYFRQLISDRLVL